MSNSQRPSKNERRDAAREKAREQRVRQQRREKRMRAVVQVGVGVVILAIVAVVAVVIVNSVRPPSAGPKNMANGGITIEGAQLAAVTTGSLAAGATPTPEPTLGDGKVRIQVWEDFGCPYCDQFETANDSYIEQIVKSGAAEVQYFPVAILDHNFSDGDYSTRAANAAVAVANYSPNQYYAFHKALYAEQPEELGPGLSDAVLISTAKKAGVSNLAAISTAIRDRKWASWIADRTDEFVAGKGALKGAFGLPAASKRGTPTVLVNGKYYSGQPSDASAFGSFVTSTGGAFSATPTPSATPMPTPTKTKKATK